MSPDERTQLAIDLAKQAGEVLMKYFGTELTRNIKTGPNDYATEADIAAEKIILEQLREAFPSDALVAEESGKHLIENAVATWIVDPLDGTHHFANGSQDFAVMISQARGPIIERTVIYNPAKDILAWGEKDQGAYLRGERVTLGEVDLGGKPLSVERDAQEQLKELGMGITNEGASVNTLDCLAGQRQAYVSSNGYDWDFAPAVLLLAEAGWEVTGLQGDPYRWNGSLEYGKPGVIAAQPSLHHQLVSLMNN